MNTKDDYKEECKMTDNEAEKSLDRLRVSWQRTRIGRRPPPEDLTVQIIIDLLIGGKDIQKEMEDRAERRLKDELALKLYEIMEKGPLAVFVQPVIKPKVFRDVAQKAIRQTAYFRELTPCEICGNFIPDGFNGGFCIKMQEYVHVNDGCTLGPKMTQDKGGTE